MSFLGDIATQIGNIGNDMIATTIAQNNNFLARKYPAFMALVNKYGIPFQPVEMNGIIYFRETETIAVISEIRKQAELQISNSLTGTFIMGVLSGTLGAAIILGISYLFREPSRRR